MGAWSGLEDSRGTDETSTRLFRVLEQTNGRCKNIERQRSVLRGVCTASALKSVSYA
jgi:hypothetical protein